MRRIRSSVATASSLVLPLPDKRSSSSNAYHRSLSSSGHPLTIFSLLMTAPPQEPHEQPDRLLQRDTLAEAPLLGRPTRGTTLLVSARTHPQVLHAAGHVVERQPHRPSIASLQCASIPVR